MSVEAVRLKLLSSFDFTDDEKHVALPLATQRLLAFLALRSDGVHRAVAAEHLWPDCDPAKAGANLRSALCYAKRIRTAPVIERVGPRLRLSTGLEVDIREMWDTARAVIDRSAPLLTTPEVIIEQLSQELLPEWTEDWLTLECERWDQLRLHALEGLAQRLYDQHHYSKAVQAALIATAIDPIRETAHRIVIEVDIAEGNLACAVRRYHEYQKFLQRELGVFPSRQMTELVQGLVTRAPNKGSHDKAGSPSPGSNQRRTGSRMSA